MSDAMTAPFARWADQYRDRPGQLPTRDKLASLRGDTLVTVRADVLRQLVVQAENHEAEARHERSLQARDRRELWMAVHDRNDPPAWVNWDGLICAVQDMPTVPVTP